MTFQKEEVAVSDAKNALERTRLALNALLARSGTHSRTFEQSLNGNVFETVTLNKHLNDDGELTNLKNRVVNAISQHLANRFDNFESDPVLTVAKILEVEHWSNDHEKLSVFGEEEINALSDHFKQLLERNDLNQEAALSEWLDLIVLVKSNYGKLRKQGVWQVMFTDFTERFCNDLMLIEIVLRFAKGLYIINSLHICNQMTPYQRLKAVTRNGIRVKHLSLKQPTQFLTLLINRS